jgi:hypothetical protein
MASFSAELHVAGRIYHLLRCSYSAYQATDARGRASAKVRHSPIELVLEAPRDNFLGAWGANPYKRCAIDIVYRDAKGGQPLETLSMTGAYCVGYGQRFQEGGVSADAQTITPSSYVVYLTLTDPDGFRIQAGGGGTYAAPAAGTHGTPLPGTDEHLAVPASTAAQELAAKKQRYNKRMDLMSRARTKLATAPAASTATQQAQEATERLARNNVAVERARLSEHVYHSDAVPPVPEPVGWHQLTPSELARKGISKEMLNDPASGFKAALYQSSFERPPKVVLAYTGTEDGVDWTTNLKQGVGMEAEQYNRAMKLAGKVAKSFPKGSVDITGHSLGGGLASAATAVTGIKGYTFNAAGLHPNTVGRAPYNLTADNLRAVSKQIDAYHSTADPLTNLQSGMHESVGGLAGALTGWPISPQALGVPRPLTPAEGWQHEWIELGKHSPLTASTNMALEGHGVDPQMVDNIEVQKSQDTATLTQYTGPTP